LDCSDQPKCFAPGWYDDMASIETHRISTGVCGEFAEPDEFGYWDAAWQSIPSSPKIAVLPQYTPLNISSWWMPEFQPVPGYIRLGGEKNQCV
jgi:hypothetical protein